MVILQVTFDPYEGTEDGTEWDDVALTPARSVSYVRLVVHSLYGSTGYGVRELQAYGESGK